MHKQTITFTDFAGKSVTEVHYFRLTMEEKLKLAAKYNITSDTSDDWTNRSALEMLEVFSELIKRAYGVRKGDRRFKKSKKIYKRFKDSLAYEALFTQLGTDLDTAVAFFTGIMGVDLDELPPEFVERIRIEEEKRRKRLEKGASSSEKGDKKKKGKKKKKNQELAEAD